jgi:hypothetical protein
LTTVCKALRRDSVGYAATGTARVWWNSNRALRASHGTTAGDIMTKNRVIWSKEPKLEDFTAAQSYLSLLCTPAEARTLVAKLRAAKTISHEAKDLLRASGLSLLPKDEAHVAADLKRIHKAKALSPVLLLQGDLREGRTLSVADGYHRICASCHIDESARIACRLITI